ncbi:bifunctional diguanylate cyclase/phosphodiesterase [Peteryoungia ipomoeae]|nr:EAL domain-containing protein [Peteryoungia ipomoeae]
MSGGSFSFFNTRSRWAILAPVALIVLTVVSTAFYADHQQRLIVRDDSRRMVQERLDLIRTRLQGQINANIRLVQGLVAVISAEPDLDQKRFAALSQSLLGQGTPLRTIEAAPNFITSFVYPQTEAQSALGAQIFTTNERSILERKLKDQGRTVIRGPRPFASGGSGLSVILPVRTVSETGEPVFWGAVVGTIDLARLYDQSGLMDFDLPISIAISRAQESGRSSIIYGDTRVLEQYPVHMALDLGSDRWSIAAIPVEGWDAADSPSLVFRIIVTLLASAAIAGCLWVALLMRDRQRHYAALHVREEELSALSNRLGLALEASRIGVWEYEVNTGEIKWDQRMYEMYGMSPEQPVNDENWLTFIHPDDRAPVREKMRLALRTQMAQQAQFRVSCPHGSYRHLRSFGTAYTNPRGETSILGVSWDVTEDVALHEELLMARNRAEQQNEALDAARRRMEYNALHDALTGLPNRRYLDQYLTELSTDPEANQLAILHIDLDRFKEINDTLGHGAGDAMLRHTAVELRENVRGEDFVARIGGDEFVIVCLDAIADDQYLEMGQRLIGAINQPTLYAGQECRVGASVGVAVRADATISPQDLLINADIALYEAKRLGRNRVERYSDHLKTRNLIIKRTGDAILKSLADDDFTAYYQPQFDAHTLEINGVEALARWMHPERGIQPPAAFLDIAENLNVVAQIDARVLDHALLQLSRWRAADLGIERVSVNISAQRLFDENLISRLEQLDLIPGSVSFELLESISFDDTSHAVAASIERLRKLGIAIEIDDFGTGYASILSLLKLSPSRLKIDRELVGPVVDNPAQRRLIASIVDIARTFGIGIVAEGVETMEHVAILRDLGCHTLQGYALARPMDAQSLIEFAKQHRVKQDEMLLMRA